MPARRTETTHVIVHHSTSVDDTIGTIRRAHRAKGMLDIGFHGVINRNGRFEQGRALDLCGNHLTGRNDTTIGVCIIGPKELQSIAQDEALVRFVKHVQSEYPYAKLEFAPVRD